MSNRTALGPAFPDLARAPFNLPPGASPVRVAAELVACFETITGLTHPTRRVFDAAAAAIALAPRSPLVRAGRVLAARIDRDAPADGPNGYHNCQHICEVMLGSLLLARRTRLPATEQARVLFAALIHDLAHDGTNNRDQPFRLERIAIAAARPVMRRAGIPPTECDRIAALVLATDLDVGAPYARGCLHRLGRSMPIPAGTAPALPAGADLGLLRLLADDARLAQQAVLLSEADLLPSVALTPKYGLRCQRRLQAENPAIDPAPAARLAFLNTHVPELVVAHFFAPNLEAQRRALRATLATVAT